ncbi:MAG: hypothetical protein ACOX3T_07070 [Bdellovibrionota bacterium]
MVKNIKYDAETKDIVSLMDEKKSTYYSYIFLAFFAVLIFVIELLPLFSNTTNIINKAFDSLHEIQEIGKNISIVDSFEKYYIWLSKFGTKGELSFFSLISLFIFNLFLSICKIFPSSPLLISSFVIISNSILQIIFVMLACWKVWAVCVIYAAVRATLNVKPYKAKDFLGVSGNGRLFYSGARADIKKCDKNGNPTLHVPGLTCLEKVSDTFYNKSVFCVLLERYNASNLTNKYLASIILHYYNYPTSIDDGEGKGNLFEDTYEFLKSAFEIQASLNQDNLSENKSNNGNKNIGVPKDNKRKVNMINSLTENMKDALKNISPKSIGTAIMALEAGRILAYDHIAKNRWASHSNYPHLCARAVLHSCPDYGDEYSFDEREMIRKAIVFAERKSDFLEIRMPLKMNIQSYTLRQWLELILHFDEIDDAIDELLFFAKSTEIHKAWTKIFVEHIENSDALKDNFYTTESGQLFVKIEIIVSLLNDAMKNDLIEMTELIKRVYNKRETDNLLSLVEQKTLSDDNNLFLKEFSEETKEEMLKFLPNESDVKVWQNLRSCLNSFSWLGKMVSDRYVPYNAVIDCKFLTNEDEIKDVAGVVLFRTSKLVDFLGIRWADEIEKVKRVVITKATEMKIDVN